jgi:polysaccharide biosynthesis/export protein
MIRLHEVVRTLGGAGVAVLLLAAPLRAPAAVPPAPSAPAAPVTPAAPPNVVPAANTVIHAGDQLAIGVYGDASLSQTAVVQPDGTIQYPLIGRIALAGKTTTEARDAMASALEKYLRHPNVTVSVAQLGQINVLVLGNVKSPGKYQIRSGARLSDAVAAASGVGASNGDYPSARVSETDGSIASVSLQKLLREGDATQNVPLQDNAIVYVTGADPIRVQVLGAVVRPGNVEVNQGDRLSMALARAGAESSVKPDLTRVFLTRKDLATGKTASYQIDMFQALQHGDMRYDPLLQKDDTVYIPEARQVSPILAGVLGVIGRLIGL